MSTWEVNFKRKLNRAFSPAHVIVEFDRTKVSKIFSHTLGKIDFNSRLDLNSSRNEVIETHKENKNINGFVYKSVGHTYLDVIETPEEEDGGYIIYAHGAPVGGTNYAGLENCHAEKMICKDGEGSDKYCNAGKCIIGRVYKESDIKWRYESFADFSLLSDPAYKEKVNYFVGGREFISLKNIIRGDFQNAPIAKITYSGSTYETSNKVGIDGAASKYTLFYIPPKFYYNQDFISLSLRRLDKELNVVAIDDTIEVFIRKILLAAYPNETEGYIADRANDHPEEPVKTALIDSFFEIEGIWREKIADIIEEEWTYRFNNIYDAQKYIRVVGEKVRELFNKGLQITKSSLKQSKIITNVSSKERPVYFRLPGATEGYRKVERDDILFVQDIEDRLRLDVELLEIGTIITTPKKDIAYRFLPRKITSALQRRRFGMSPTISDSSKKELYSAADVLSWSLFPLDRLPDDDVSKYLTSGVDEFLMDKKDSIDNFYRDFLDPDTCDPSLLDWLAQHIGLFGELWNQLWDKDLKATMIKNAFGWFDQNSSVALPNDRVVLTEKGKNLKNAPFNNDKIWTNSDDSANNVLVDFSKIEKIIVNTNDIKQILGEYKYTIREFDSEQTIVNETNIDRVLFNTEAWNGLFEAKGSMLVVAFLSSLMNLKSPSAKELEIIKLNQDFKSSKVIRPKSGLRSIEQDSTPLLPCKFESIRVGNEQDAEVNNYPNQFVAGVSRVSSVEESKNVFFRVPYYYNRDGKSWDRVNYITKNWLPNNLNSKIQYPYLSASLWAVGDAFFEPEIIDEE